MIAVVTRKESRNSKVEIKKIDTIIARNKNQIKALELEKQKLEKEKNKYFAEIKKLDKTMKIDEIYQIKKQIKNNNEEIAKLKNILPNKPLKKTYMIVTSEAEIKKANENIISETAKEEKIYTDIITMEIEGTNLEQQMENFNDNNLDKTLDLWQLKLKTTKLLIKLERRECKRKKIFARIANNELIIANKYLLIAQKDWKLYPNIRTKKEIFNGELIVKLKYKMNNMCDLNLGISKKNLKITKINKMIAKLNLNINEKNIEIKNCFAKIRQIYNSQQIKVENKKICKSPLIWLNKCFQKYKYQIMLNQYRTQLRKLEKEITRLETNKLTGNFYNKLWFIISCGFFNNHQKNENRDEKIAKLYEIKKKIYELEDQRNIQAQQPSLISRNVASWNEVTRPNDPFNEVRYNNQIAFPSFLK
ncbi:hypothetical protein [Spiroplasma endosymbiont of Polydrusus pterygomalis]|uniref:hypothetical protein n=1 Tax=Spiroplasma endosymbiont of Polydrusus pterygomalis TaxID=3139327 RepID=UPI003CCAE327